MLSAYIDLLQYCANCPAARNNLANEFLSDQTWYKGKPRSKVSLTEAVHHRAFLLPRHVKLRMKLIMTHRVDVTHGAFQR